jgi:8-oxo-dGTP pyrophosphatase MutT (NUDIX family)
MRSWFDEDEEDTLLVTYPGKPKYLLNYLDKVEKSKELQRLVIFSNDPATLLEEFFELFKIVVAAGGVVLNELGEIFFIFRRGHWDLPKGKMEFGETKRETALREVKEETGLGKLKIIDKLAVTYHIFRTSGGKRVLKPSHWFLMTTPNKSFKLQTEEDIEDARWINVTDSEALAALRPVYTNIKDVVEELQHIMR